MLRGLVMAGLLFALPALADEVTLHTSTGDLHGTFLGGGSPVLILAGSGPTDRDGNAPAMGLHTDMYKLLADGLGVQGFGSLRADKRGIGESRAALTTEKDLTIQTYADDARAWVAELRRLTGQRCVWLLGHSEGALVAEITASQDAADVCGVILVAGAGRPLGTVIREQLHANPANPPALVKAADDILDQLEAGHAVSDVPPALAALFRPSVQPYLMSELTLDPAALLAKVRMPTLVLQGGNDLQVSVADAKLLAAARPDITLVLLHGVNHLLKEAPADRAGNLATYANPALPLAPDVITDIRRFINSSLNRGLLP
jgi:pimeloyl-ACP methyl ester carboxylesterase